MEGGIQPPADRAHGLWGGSGAGPSGKESGPRTLGPRGWKKIGFPLGTRTSPQPHRSQPAGGAGQWEVPPPLSACTSDLRDPPPSAPGFRPWEWRGPAGCGMRAAGTWDPSRAEFLSSCLRQKNQRSPTPPRRDPPPSSCRSCAWPMWARPLSCSRTCHGSPSQTGYGPAPHAATEAPPRRPPLHQAPQMPLTAQ